MKTTIKTASDNELNEALEMYNRALFSMEREFLHVSITPPSLLRAIKKEVNKVIKELEKREKI